MLVVDVPSATSRSPSGSGCLDDPVVAPAEEMEEGAGEAICRSSNRRPLTPADPVGKLVSTPPDEQRVYDINTYQSEVIVCREASPDLSDGSIPAKGSKGLPMGTEGGLAWRCSTESGTANDTQVNIQQVLEQIV